MIERYDDTTTCAICARQAVGIGFTPLGGKGKPIQWLCDDPVCIRAATQHYHMRQDTFNRIESRAAQDGGAEGGGYLDKIGKTDLATLTPDEWAEFCRRMIAGYRKGLVERTHNEAPF